VKSLALIEWDVVRLGGTGVDLTRPGDFLLGVFGFLGLEHATVPDDYTHRHYLLFTFPYSHGLLPLFLWAAIAGLLISRLSGLDRARDVAVR